MLPDLRFERSPSAAWKLHDGIDLVPRCAGTAKLSVLEIETKQRVAIGIARFCEGVPEYALPREFRDAPIAGASVLTLELVILHDRPPVQRELGALAFFARGFKADVPGGEDGGDLPLFGEGREGDGYLLELGLVYDRDCLPCRLFQLSSLCRRTARFLS